MTSPMHRWAAWARLCGVALLLTACGGGVDSGGTGPTGGSYVEGPITGFGSIIVGGVRFDDSSARVEDADGSGRSRDDLRLGMRVQIESGTIADDGSGGRAATATRVRFASDLIGPVTAADAQGAQIGVIGQTVRITAATVVDGASGGAASLVVGDVVEVHGFPSAEGYVATRIERRSPVPTAFRVRGLVSELAPPTLRIGSQTFDLTATGVPAALANGQFVRLTVATAQVAGVWPVTAISVEARRVEDRDEAEVEGLITSLASVTRFAVNGVSVDASAATVRGNVALGARVKVRGRSAGGVVVAALVEVRNDDDVADDGIDLRDVVANLDERAQTFTVKGVAVTYDGNTRFEKGNAADLDNGDRVRVRGKLASDRTRVIAERIEFTD
jgi:Domain of unknown function (DUF5666)